MHSPGVIGLEEVSVPTILDGQVLIRPIANGLCGTDLELIDGTSSRWTNGLTRFSRCARQTRHGHAAKLSSRSTKQRNRTHQAVSNNFVTTDRRS